MSLRMCPQDKMTSFFSKAKCWAANWPGSGRESGMVFVLGGSLVT